MGADDTPSDNPVHCAPEQPAVALNPCRGGGLHGHPGVVSLPCNGRTDRSACARAWRHGCVQPRRWRGMRDVAGQCAGARAHGCHGDHEPGCGCPIAALHHGLLRAHLRQRAADACGRRTQPACAAPDRGAEILPWRCPHARVHIAPSRPRPVPVRPAPGLAALPCRRDRRVHRPPALPDPVSGRRHHRPVVDVAAARGLGCGAPAGDRRPACAGQARHRDHLRARQPRPCHPPLLRSGDAGHAGAPTQRPHLAGRPPAAGHPWRRLRRANPFRWLAGTIRRLALLPHPHRQSADQSSAAAPGHALLVAGRVFSSAAAVRPSAISAASWRPAWPMWCAAIWTASSAGISIAPHCACRPAISTPTPATGWRA